MPNCRFVPQRAVNFVTAFVAQQKVTIPIGELDEKEIEEYAELNKKHTLEHWTTKRAETLKAGGGK